MNTTQKTRRWPKHDNITSSSVYGTYWIVVATGFLTPQKNRDYAVRPEVVRAKLYAGALGWPGMYQADDGRTWRQEGGEEIAGEYATREEADARALEIRESN